MILFILRGAFILLVAAVMTLYVVGDFQQGAGIGFGAVTTILLGTLLIAGAVVAADAASPRKRLSALSGVFLGIIAGLLTAYALSFVVDLIAIYTLPTDPSERDAFLKLFQGIKVVIGLVTCYLGISLVLQTKDDFRFVIPYVEFAKQVRGQRPTLLDTSVIIDGRILDIVQTRLLQGVLIVPKFVLNELQLIADSPEKLRRARGRRGLEILQKLQDSTIVDVVIEEAEAEGGTVDQKLVAMARDMQARVMTNDFNLNKIASLRGVDVINLHELAKALRPVALPGESLTVRIVKPGESPSQGVGYLEDGTMVVVENARMQVGHEIELVVTSTIQTSAGRMIFGRFAGDAEHEPRESSHDADASARGETPPAGTGDDAPPRPAPPSPGAAHPPRPRTHLGRNPRRH